MNARSQTNRDPFGNAFAGKRVLLTGHTGFKGGWLALWLEQLGAQVRGISLAPDTQPALFDLAGVGGAPNGSNCLAARSTPAFFLSDKEN